MKRAGTLLAALAIVALIGSPAAAQKVTEVKLLDINDGAVLHGPTELRAQASSPSGVKQLRIIIDGDEVAAKQPDGVQQKTDTAFSWDTIHEIGGAEFARNGEYEIKAIAISNGGGSDQVTIDVLVDNPPIIPTGLQVATNGQGVTLQWDPNPEPDIVGYLVQRDSGAGAEIVGRPSTTTFFEEIEPGEHSYTVTAVRASAVNAEGIPSAPSGVVAASIAAPSAGGRGPRGTTSSVGHVKSTRGGFVTDKGVRFGSSGLSSGVAAPGVPAAPPVTLPELPGGTWGPFDKRLPYDIDTQPVETSTRAAPTTGSRATSWFTVVPPDGLRWVAAGLLLMVTATLLAFLSRRLLAAERASTVTSD